MQKNIFIHIPQIFLFMMLLIWGVLVFLTSCSQPEPEKGPQEIDVEVSQFVGVWQELEQGRTLCFFPESDGNSKVICIMRSNGDQMYEGTYEKEGLNLSLMFHHAELAELSGAKILKFNTIIDFCLMDTDGQWMERYTKVDDDPSACLPEVPTVTINFVQPADYNPPEGYTFLKDMRGSIDSPIANLPEPPKTGYAFLGWFLYVDGQETDIPIGRTFPPTDISVYPRWKREVTVRLLGASSSNNVLKGEPGEKVTLPIPREKFWDFCGWFLGDGTFQPLDLTLPDSDIILVADEPFYNDSPFNYIDINETECAVTGYQGDGTNICMPYTHGVKFVTKIGRIMFPSSVAIVSIPETVDTIGDAAFANNSTIQQVMISDSVTSIGDAVFNDCRDLTDVRLPSGLTAISDSMFLSCRSLRILSIPETVETIGRLAFADTALEEIILPLSLTTIEDMAFSMCERLTKIVIPSKVTSIGENAFAASYLLSIVIDRPTNSIPGAPWGARYATVEWKEK